MRGGAPIEHGRAGAPGPDERADAPEPGDRPVNISGQRLTMAFWLSIFIFPFAVVGFGLATWWKRR